MTVNLYNSPKLRETKNVTAARDIAGTIYHNTTGLPVYVSIVLTLPTASVPEIVYVFADVPAAPLVTVNVESFVQITGATAYKSMNFWVLPDNYYKVTHTGANVALGQWLETE